MNYRVNLNGQDITEKLDIKSCVASDRLGGMNDDMLIEIPYECKLTFDKYDEIEVIAGQYSTGIMYIDECCGVNNNRSCVIKSLSSKHSNRRKKTRVWYDVTLYQLINTVAEDCGLYPQFYDTTNYTYKAVFQNNESDLQFLNRICKREGYSVKCSGRYLIVFNERALEKNQNPISIKADEVSYHSFKRKANCLSEFTVSYYDLGEKMLYSHTAKDSSIQGGTSRKIEIVSNQGEAERFANGYLREANNAYLSGLVTIPYNPNMSAGTVAELSGFSDYDDTYIVYELTNDFTKELTHLKLRNTLEY